MFNYKVVRELNYSNKQMFDLIIDVEKYPEFLPWCKSTNVYEKKSNIFYSDMEIGFSVVKESFTSKVTSINSEKILSEAISGPFNKMNNIFGYTQTKGIIEPSLLLPERRFLFLFKNTYLCDSFIQLLTKIWA